MFKIFINLIFSSLFVPYFICTQNVHAMESTQHNSSHNKTLEKNIKGAMDTLSVHGNNFAFYDLNLSENEIDVLNELQIEQKQMFMHQTENLEDLESKLEQYIKTVGTPYHTEESHNGKNANKASKIIVELVNRIIQASGEETAQVRLQSFEPSTSFDVPRWHTDGYAFNERNRPQYKFGIALKGASTVFYKLPADKINEFSNIYATARNNREKLANFLNDPKAISIGKPNQGAVFIMGSENPAIHTEPAIKKPRLFLAVTPCKKSVMRGWIEQIRKEELEREQQ